MEKESEAAKVGFLEVVEGCRDHPALCFVAFSQNREISPQRIQRRNETRLALLEEHLKDRVVAMDKTLKCVEILYWRSRPKCLVEGCLSMDVVRFLQSVWEKPNWEVVWPFLDPLDRVCASMEWNVPGKYGPHGEIFFFLIQKEPATVLVSGTLSPFINADIRAPLFSADVLKKCALKKEETEMDFKSLVWGTNGRWAAQRVQRGRVKAKLGRRMKMRPPAPLVKAMRATMRCTSSGCMAW